MEWWVVGLRDTYPTYDGIVVCEMGLAVLAAVDLARVEVDVVGEPHLGSRRARLLLLV